MKCELIYEQKECVCGMIGGRHDMPFQLYIWPERIPNEKIKDYDWLESQVISFINDNVIQSGGLPNKRLVVGVTGLTSAASAVIKVCNQMRVNLSFLHYNMETLDYDLQVIWNNFGPESIIKNLSFERIYALRDQDDEPIEITDESIIVCMNYKEAIITKDESSARTVLYKSMGNTVRDLIKRVDYSDVNISVRKIFLDDDKKIVVDVLEPIAEVNINTSGCHLEKGWNE